MGRPNFVFAGACAFALAVATVVVAAAEDLPIVRETRDSPLRTVLSNSFGFGGTNACLVLRRWDG